MESTDIDVLETPSEVAAKLRLRGGTGTLAVWRATKRYPDLAYIKVGRAVRYRKSTVEAFIRARTISGDI